MRFKAVIFDFDGTLADTNELIIDSWQHTYRVLTGEEQDEEVLRATFGEPLDLSMKHAFPGVPVRKSIDVYRSHQTDVYDDMVRPFEGMTDLIRTLKEKEYKTGILTSRLKPSTMAGLEKFGLIPYIDSIVTYEDCAKFKPDPEPMYTVLKKLGVRPEEALMVGDSLFDIRCAHNAGVRAVLVGWAFALSAPPRDGPDKPDYIINKACELWEII